MWLCAKDNKACLFNNRTSEELRLLLPDLVAKLGMELFSLVVISQSGS